MTLQRLCLVLFTLLLTAPAWSKVYTTTARNRNLGEAEGTRTFDNGIVTVKWSNCKTGPAWLPANRNWEMAYNSTVTITCKEGWRVRAFYVDKQLKNAEYLYCSSDKTYWSKGGLIANTDAPQQSITITAGNYVEFAEYTIDYVQVRPLSFKKSSYTVGVDQVLDTPLDQMIDNPSGSSITWSIGNTNVAEIQNGKVKGKGVGQTTLTAKVAADEDHALAEATATINVVRDIHPSLAQTAITMKAWENPQIPKLNGMPNDYDGQITYESSDNGVAVVEGGRLKFGGSGYGRSATITVKIPQTRKYKGATLKFTVNVDNEMRIASREDWKKFCDLVNSGKASLNVKLMKDIDLGTDITMAGNGKSYSGTFDGQGHALKINWNSGNKTDIAPFKSVEGATIKNLRTEGEINSNTHFLSGLICNVYGNTTISGCVSAVNITSTYNGSGCDAAGMIECVWHNAKVTITDCVVKGKFHATTEQGQRYMAGFVRDQYAPCTLTNCLYAGTNNASGGYTFAPTNAILNNCYYLNTCGDEQGTKVTAEQLKSGEVAYQLQNKRTGNVWGQFIQVDEQPLLTTEAAKHVYQVSFTYKGRVKATRYANNGKPIFAPLPTVQDLLGSEYDSKKTYTLTYDGGFSETTAITGDRTVNVTVAITTGIDGVTNDAADTANGPVYDLQGRRVADRLDDATRQQLPAGVYIVGGRKVIVK